MILPIFVVVAFSASALGDYNGTYYNGIEWHTLNGTALQASLFKLISQKKSVSYDGVWNAFTKEYSGDGGCVAPKIRGCYSKYCWDKSQQCGSYKKEGDCYNREHGWPKSWWGGFSAGQGAQTDLFHLFPADGYVNSLRASYALGEVDNPTYTSTAGAKLGPCVVDGFSGTCFEVPDAYKGNFARAYFYLSTAYMGKFQCCNVDGVNGSVIKPWMAKVLLKWHQADGPDQEEQDLNDEIFNTYQGNRNPYIDFPLFATLIWGE